MEITLPEELWDIPTQMITTELLGTVRIVGARFENPDGSALELDRDIIGNVRGARQMVGPVESADKGKNRVKVWTKRAEDKNVFLNQF